MYLGLPSKKAWEQWGGIFFIIIIIIFTHFKSDYEYCLADSNLGQPFSSSHVEE